ncbi:MAG: CoB--CoM heterodisulfide reductase iron-sulfur subunit A family protein [Pseudomonadota bacterium]
MSDGKTPRQPKVGVYICHCGGNISDHVDVQRVEDLAGGLPGVTVARQNSFMCSDPGQEMIIKDIQEGRVDRVVVASCAPALHETTFRGAMLRAGLNPYLYEHANIREQVSWVHHGPGATGKAAKLVAAAVAKAGLLESLEPIRVEAQAHATVVGAGPAGLKAALDLAGRGIRVTLVEKTPFLGGNLARLENLYPTGEKASQMIEDLAGLVLGHELIEVLTCAEISTAGGYVGNFDLTVTRRPPREQREMLLVSLARAAGRLPGFTPFAGFLPAEPPGAVEQISLRSGALIVATGFEHYQPYVGQYGYGQLPQVITLPELIQIMAKHPAGQALTVNGRQIASLALIHCVGSREIPGLHEPPDGRPLNEYCSRVCCTATLQAALEIKQRFPETVVYDLHRDIRTYGRGHEDYYLDSSRRGVLFLRFGAEDPPQVRGQGQGQGEGMVIEMADTLLGGERLELETDLVVLAVGMRPGPVANLAEMLKLAVGADRFLLEVHPKLRPVEPAVAGIYLAGTCQAPMDTGEACAAASAAAVKAGGVLSRGYVELAPFVAQVDQEACDGCGACLEACLSEGALSLTQTPAGAKALVNPALCLGCGVCAAVCQPGAIAVAGWTLPQYEAMVRAITAPSAGEEQA